MIDSSPVRCLPSSCQIDRTSIRVRPEADVSFVPAFLPAKAKEKAVEEAVRPSSKLRTSDSSGSICIGREMRFLL